MNFNFFALLATLSIFILSCRDTKKTSQAQNPKRVFKGNVVIGHEAQSFSPCNSQNAYWIDGNPKFEHLDSLYQKFRYPMAYSPVYVEMTATLDTVSERIGFAFDYDGYILLDSFLKVEMLEPYNDCHNHLANTTDQTFPAEQVSFNVFNFEFGNYTHTTVTPLEFRISKNYLKHTVLGQLESIQVTDLDKNGFQEVVFKQIQQGYLQGEAELYEDHGVYRIDRSKEINFAIGLFFRKTDCL